MRPPVSEKGDGLNRRSHALLMKSLAQFLFGGCLLLLLSIGGVAHAQTLYEIEGIVYNQSRNPIERVVVFLENQARARVNYTMTDPDGRYRFSRGGRSHPPSPSSCGRWIR